MDGIYKLTELKSILLLFIYFIALIILFAQNNYYNPSNDKTPSEFYLILLTNVLGITSLLYSNDWVMTIISWELFNFSLYLLVSLNSYSESSLSSALKYFILSALSTGFLLLGISIIYLLTGSTHYDNIDASLSQLTIAPIDGTSLLLTLGFILIIFTLLFKLSAAPFYHWAPDLYDSLNTNITMWMIIIPKLTIISLLLLLSLEHSLFTYFSYTETILLITGSLSLIIGSVALTQQWKVKRFFAYSGISHIGFILLALYCYDLHSYIIYFVVYAITTLNLFNIFLIISKYQGKDLNYISQLIGLFKFNPFLSVSLAINLFSLAGRYVCLKFYKLLGN
jgi:NADH-quinone oxidoreductase subunit N